MLRNQESVNVLIFQYASRKVGEVIASHDAWLPIPRPGETVHLAEAQEPPTAWKVMPLPHFAYLGGNIIVTIDVKPIPYEPVIHLV